MKKVILFILVLVVISCSKSTSPKTVYDEYYNHLTTGMSFEDQNSYFSERKKLELQSELQDLAENSDHTKSAWKTVFVNNSKLFANCISISFVKQEIRDNTASVHYAKKDACNENSDNGVQEFTIITMVFEDGWKIDDIKR